MANISVKKDQPSSLSTFGPQAMDPFRIMRDMLAWDPFRDLRPMNTFNLTEATFAPTFEVKETKDQYLFKADVPGVKDGDIDVSITGDRLLISGKREAEVSDKGDTWYTYERTYGSFSRSFTLPTGVDVDHAKAELKDGVLSLALPKVPEAQARKISVKATEKMKA